MTKELNRFQKDNIEKYLKELAKDKDLDKMQEDFCFAMMARGLNNNEVGALLTTIMIRMLFTGKNKEAVEKMGINENNMNLELAGNMQIMFAKQYYDDMIAKDKNK